MSKLKTYNASDVILSIGQKKHTPECNTSNQVERWLWVPIQEFRVFIDCLSLYPFANPIGDCIGYHALDNPASEMLAKAVSQSMDGVCYAIYNHAYEDCKCDCDGEVVYTEIKGFGCDE